MADPRLDVGELYARHRDELLAFFVRRTSDIEVALDLWSETFAQALAGRGRYRGGTEEEAGRGCTGSRSGSSRVTTVAGVPSAAR